VAHHGRPAQICSCRSRGGTTGGDGAPVEFDDPVEDLLDDDWREAKRGLVQHGWRRDLHSIVRDVGRRGLSLITLEPFWKPRRLVLAGRIALGAGHAGAAAATSVRTFPGLVGMVLANPAGIIAAKAFHAVTRAYLKRESPHRPPR
jgi:hypothetical protein